MKSFVVTLLLASAATAADAPKPAGAPPQFPSQVEVVTVDTVILDKKGNPVTDLTAADFTLLEDGQPQKIASFEKVELPADSSPTVTTRPPVSSNQAAESRTGRTFVVVFDDLHLRVGQARDAKAAVSSFLAKSTREGDRVTLVATGGGTWWTAHMTAGREQLVAALKHLEGREARLNGMDTMGDWEAMRINEFGDQQVAGRVLSRWQSLGVPGVDASNGSTSMASSSSPSNAGMIDPYVSMRAVEIYQDARNRNRSALEIIQRSLQALTGTHGRKSMILVSEGFIADPELEQFRKIRDAARRADVAVYFLDTRGLQAMPDQFSAEFGPPSDPSSASAAFLDLNQESEGAQEIADDTGGFSIKNSNNLNAGIDRIANESRAYYLIGYNPTNLARDGKWRKIQVKVTRKGVDIRARKGYYAPVPEEASADTARKLEDRVHDQFREALDSPADTAGIPLRMSAYVGGETMLGKATTVVISDIDTSRFSFEEKDGKLVDAVEIVLVVTQQETGEYWDRSETVEMGVPAAGKTQAKISTWHSLVRDFDLPAGTFQAKIAVRHPKSGRIGTVTHEFVVPSLGAWRVSTVALTDTAQAGAAGEVPQPVLVARRTFKPPILFGKFDVYGAVKDETTHASKVTFSYVVKSKEGTAIASMAPREIPINPQGAIRQIFAFRTGTWKAGDYNLVLTVRDEIAGESKEIVEPFSIGEPEAGLPATAEGSKPSAE